MEYNTNSLPNGIRIAHLPYASDVAYCGFAINCGSSDEDTNQYGTVHFIEHMLFKGTKTRKTWQILNSLENVGGEINAYTTKEETFVYAAVPKQYFRRAAELMTDILFNSTFPENELKKEREVIVDEINSYKDAPYDSIYDDFEDQVFESHPLGHNILGTKKSLKKIQQQDLSAFMQQKYYTNQTVFFAMGDFTFKNVFTLATKLLTDVPSNEGNPVRTMHSLYAPNEKTVAVKNHQAHYMMGNLAYSLHHDDRLAFYLLNNLLGGSAMNSRLNMSLRERHGIAYNIESNYTAYTETGLWSIYFGTDERNLEKSKNLINKELRLFRDKALTSSQLVKAKKQLIGQLCIGHENKESHFLNFGKSILHFNEFESMADTVARINAVDASKILEISNTVFDPAQQSSLLLK